MATINLVQGKFESYLDSGALNNGGTIGIYEPDGTYSTLKTHYNSSSLSTPNANPLTLDSAGRATIYYAGDADIRVRDSLGNIIYSQRNVSPQTVVSVVSLVGNTTIDVSHYAQFIQVSGVGITLTLSDAGILNSGWYTEIVNTNSSNSVTIARATGGDTINGTAANITLLPNQSINIFVNASANGFIVTAKRSHSKGERLESSLWMAEGADVASASDCNIWTTDGNTVHITGTTTITDWGTAQQAGAWKYVIFDDAVPLTYNATTNKLNTNGANYTTVAGDRAIVYAESTSSYNVTLFPIDGQSPVDPTVTTTPARNSDTTAIPTTEWVRDHIGEPSSNLSMFKCGGLNLPQNATRYLRAIGASITATEADAQVGIGLPTEIYRMKIYVREAIPAGQTLTINIRKNGSNTTLTSTLTGPTTAGAVTNVNADGTVVFSKNYAGTADLLSVQSVTSATFGNTNDVVVTLLTKVPGSNYKPVSSFALSAQAQGAGNYGAAGEFGNSSGTTALLSSTITAAQIPLPRNAVMMKYDQAVATGFPYLNNSAGQQVTGNYNIRFAEGETVSFVDDNTNVLHSEYIVFSDRECGNEYGTWAPMLFSSTSQAQATTVYMGGYSTSSASATEDEVKISVPAAKCWKLRARAMSAVPAGQTAILTVRKNGSNQTVTVTLNDTNQWAEDTSNSFTTVDDDFISISCTLSATTGTLTIHATLELDRNA